MNAGEKKIHNCYTVNFEHIMFTNHIVLRLEHLVYANRTLSDVTIFSVVIWDTFFAVYIFNIIHATGFNTIRHSDELLYNLFIFFSCNNIIIITFKVEVKERTRKVVE